MTTTDIVIQELKDKFKEKQEQYKGKTEDAYRNFNQGAVLQSETPEQTLLGYVNKQITNLFDCKIHHPERLSDVAYINEVAGDIAVYMIILIAMVRDKQNG